MSPQVKTHVAEAACSACATAWHAVCGMVFYLFMYIYIYVYIYIYIWDKEKSEKARHVAFPVSSLGAIWGDSSSLCFEVSRKS